MTRTKSAKALLVALLSLAIVIAFMPAMAQSSYAASKLKVKPSKKTISVKKTVKLTAKGLSAKQLKKVKWSTTKAGKKIVKLSASKGKTIKVTGKKAGKATITAKYGKKKAKATITVKAAAIKTTVASVKIDNTTPNVGDTLTASLADKDGKAVTDSTATYQWYRMLGTSEIQIPGATASTYQVTDKDVYDTATTTAGYVLYVKVKIGDKEIKSAATDFVTNKRALKSVEIVLPNKHTAPQVGDVLSLEVKDSLDKTIAAKVVTENFDIQWYANGAKIDNAKDATYTVTAATKGKVISAKVSAKKNTTAYSGELESKATEAVIASIIPTGVTVKTSAAAPYVGETIEAVFTPTGSSDADATYQWYRGSAEISGATASTYTVTPADKGSTLTVKATLSTKDQKGATVTVAATTPTVGEALTGGKVTLESTNTTAGKTVYTTGDEAKATITPDGTYDIEWYIDSVADANKLYTNIGNTDAEQNVASGSSLDLDATYYLYKAATPTSLVGHKLVAVAKTTSTNAKQGTITSDATAAVQVALASNSVKIAGDTGDSYIATKTTLTATVDKASDTKDPTVTYKWYATTDEPTAANAEWKEISGVVGNTYTITTADDTAAVQGYKVVVTGTGNYYGTVEAKTGAIDIQSAATTQAVTLKINGEDAYQAQPGETLTATTAPAAAGQYVTYKWTYQPKTGSVQTATGATYTVPTDSAQGSTVTLTATTTYSDYTIETGTKAVATVQGKITDAKLTSSADKAKTTQDAGYDGVATPAPGESLTVHATAGEDAQYEFFADGTSVQAKGSKDTYTITKADLGKKITAKVYGGTGYTNAVATTDATGTVTAKASLTIKAGNVELGNGNAAAVDDTLTATVAGQMYANGAVGAGEDLTSEMTYVWKVDGVTVKASNKAGNEYKVQPEDEGKTITCEATNANVTAVTSGALTWNNGLKIAPKTASVTL